MHVPVSTENGSGICSRKQGKWEWNNGIKHPYGGGTIKRAYGIKLPYGGGEISRMVSIWDVFYAVVLEEESSRMVYHTGFFRLQ